MHSVSRPFGQMGRETFLMGCKFYFYNYNFSDSKI